MNAREIYYVILAALAGFGAWLARVLGGWDAPLRLLTVMMGIDYLTGVVCAWVWHKSPKTENGGISSAVGIKGLLRKGAIVLVVLIAAELDRVTGEAVTRNAVIFFFAANEGFSIIENLGIMGVPFPAVVKNAFEVLRNKGEREETREAVKEKNE